MYVGYPSGPAGGRPPCSLSGTKPPRSFGRKLPQHQRGAKKLSEIHIPRASQPAELANDRPGGAGAERGVEPVRCGVSRTDESGHLFHGRHP